VLQRAHRRLLKDSCTPAILIQAVRELFAPSSASGNASPTASTPSAGVQTTKRRTIVFVEDNQVVSMAYRNRLEAGGFRVEPAEDGLEAMKILSRQVPDVVVLDLMLPKLSGVEVLKFMCSNPRLSAVSVIILSNNSVIDVGEEYVLERASKRLLKSSCTPAIMLQTIREMLDGPSAVDGASSDDPSGKPNNEKGLIQIRIGN
jgi:CheY-like chemotaxis protein